MLDTQARWCKDYAKGPIHPGSIWAFLLLLLSSTQVNLTNEVKQLQQFLWLLRTDVDTLASQRHWRRASCPRAPAFALHNPEALPSSRARSGLPAEPAAKEILSVCKGSWAAAAYGRYEAKTSRVEGFIVQHDFSRCCVSFKHLPFSARVLLLCIKLALGMIYLLGRRRGLPLS